ncbi:MAG: M20/M25/M40 family metallo-hydrolase [Coriobacteriia bacterium]|nr:M20/M25/M40 family metallo-hydrolase [Coriobacteriia bacterium]
MASHSSSDAKGGDLRSAVHDLMPRLEDDLKRLIRIPSIASPGYPEEELFKAHDLVIELLRDAGVEQIGDIRLEGKIAPVITAEIPGPPGSPTVLMYTHYDVVPAGDEELWETPPFEPTERNGAIYGRGASDSKANLVAIIGAVRAWDAKPPVTLRLVFEGQEEFGSPFDFFPPTAPEHFAADAIVIADVGNVRPGVPTLSVGLRGDAAVNIEVRTLAADKHSGQFGGAAPDALLALIHALATLHDENGDVAVAGLKRTPWTGASYTDEEFRGLAEMLPDMPYMGTGTLGERIWTGPAITVTGIDVPSVDEAVAAVQSHARARLNVRVHPEQPALEAQDAVVAHLEALRPFGIPLTVIRGDVGDGYAPKTDGPAYDAARDALRIAWGEEATYMANGGSIPLVRSLADAVPEAELLLFGATDGYSNIHAPNERVLLDEFERSVLVKAEFLRSFADRWGERG